MINRYASLRQGLVGAWCPSLGASGFRLIDRSGNGNHGTLTNMDPGTDWVPSSGKLALDFDGADDTVQISGSNVYAANGQAFTASIYAYVRNFNNAYTKLLLLKSDCSGNNAWELGVSNDGAYLGILIGTSISYARIKTDTLSATITGGWHHYAVVYNGGTRSSSGSFSIYFDSILQSNSTAGSFSATTNTTSISLNASQNRLNGFVDDVRIYNRALTPSEIRILYTGGRGVGLLPERIKHRRKISGTNRRRRIICGANC